MNLLIFRKKISENSYTIQFYEYHFWGFIANKKGFTNRFFNSIIPFSNGKAAWHFLGFRFTKSFGYVSKNEQTINGHYTNDKNLVTKLRSL